MAVRSVRIVHDVDHVGSLRMLRQGYQSWSRTAVATLGSDRDPSTTPGSLEMMQGVHHADQRSVKGDELRSEWVTVARRRRRGRASSPGSACRYHHDGTWRLRTAEDGRVELTAEAFLGDATLASGARRALHAFGTRARRRSVADARQVGDARAGEGDGARTGAPYQVGWCSWYHYFHDVTEEHIKSNLARAAEWPFDVFQIDDGYQAAIGDWLVTNEKFPSELSSLAPRDRGRRSSTGYLVGAVHRRARLAGRDTSIPTGSRERPNGKPLWGMFNPSWGGGLGGVMYALDTTQPDVLAHLEQVARSLVEFGLHLPEARLHLRAELRRRVVRLVPDTGRARARRL